ncbi:phage tail protein [Azospirillum brasilense]|uniref:phage GP46 family protein n=1 Tax=Azospirillum argentinense TaxID=2970906 RepID=UPI00190CFA1D|nr:phage GP46 family protein [Azospirillum argentinense]MBK3797866.1 phage tail protein [Azospirillum argentinense]
MSYFVQDRTVVIDGVALSLDLTTGDPLVRAVLMSLFTWARAQPGDVLPADRRMGWWGDTFPTVAGDRIGSRLWLLSREKLLPETLRRAREYAEEALAWLVTDGVAQRVEVTADRRGADGLTLTCRIWRRDGTPVDLRFDDAWEAITNG